jgi:hypothetical protein
MVTDRGWPAVEYQGAFHNTKEDTMKIARILLTAALAPPPPPGPGRRLEVPAHRRQGLRPAFVASVTGGMMDPKHVGSGDAWGLELAMNCGLLQTPTGVVRTKLSVQPFDKDGLELQTVELNPRWTTPIAQDLTLGVGPGIGWVKADAAAAPWTCSPGRPAPTWTTASASSTWASAPAGRTPTRTSAAAARRRQLAGAGQGRHRVLTLPSPAQQAASGRPFSWPSQPRVEAGFGDLGGAQRGASLGLGLLPFGGGSESATMPAPAWTWIMPSLTTAVRMAMARSMSPWKPM